MKHLLKNYFTSLLGIVLLTATAQAQPPGMGAAPGPQFGGGLTKVFGDNPNFSGTTEFKMTGGGPQGQEITMPGAIAYSEGKSRFEMDMTAMKGISLPPQALEQMKAMHMDKMAVISRPDKKVNYMIYTGLKAYVEMPLKDESAAKTPADFKMDVTSLGAETVDGHDCAKNKVVVTDDKGTAHEMTVWNAKDLKNFPVKIKSAESGSAFEMTFKDIKLSKPDEGRFDPPADFTKYDDMMKLIMSGMKK